ncbi:efflux transporter outer membrane subunit [Pseudomonas sp. RIT-To-2]|uniref:efflux transporter outer membrane subunit n=1 Tax=Pseudomonas sp. RIT-To-2 TaxID=3462541 RepID=UPI0024133823
MPRYLLAWPALLLAGCSLIPDYQRPALPTAAHYPGTTAADAHTQAVAADDWRQVFHDPALRQLIDQALANNRDLRVAALTVESYRAQYRIQRAALLPQVDASAQRDRERVPASLTGTGAAVITDTDSVTLGISAYEVDLFGRVRSLRDQALLTYLGSEEARRSVQLSLITSVASAYLTWRADQALLDLAGQTLAADEQSLRLTTRQRQTGTVSALDQVQARTPVYSTRAAQARYRRQVAEDLNQLTALVGTPLADSPSGLALDQPPLASLPAGLPSDLLQRRPDIRQAEYQLQAANAAIGAARAAFFPSITLTATAGTSSSELSGLFRGGSGSWVFEPQLSVPIFTAGSLRASLDYARLQENVQVANYEKAIQGAFQEVADGLAARATYQRQLQAQRDLVAANERYYRLAQHRYRSGLDSNLVFLDAQRSLFTAQEGLITDQLAQWVAEVNLYGALGGGWPAPPQG